MQPGKSPEPVRLIGSRAGEGEYVALGDGGHEEVVHLHDYERLYAVPGLYEHIVQDLLGCRSPQVVARGLSRALGELAIDPGSLCLLDLGAGTGLVGELVRGMGVGRVIGLDALNAARDACRRDRPHVYRDYLIGDLANSPPELLRGLRAHRPRGLVSAGALGGTHAPPAALIQALALLPADAPVVFTIDERWMQTDGPGGFRTSMVRLLGSGALRLIERSRFQHRLDTSGRPIHYELIAGVTGSTAGVPGP